MGSIVCATRGGEGSRAVQMEAISRAKRNRQRLVFLYVTDPSAVGAVDEMLKTAVREELNWMGHTLLRIAQHRAQLAGLETELVIREGHLQEAIERFLRESDATLLLLGASRNTTGTVFGDDAVERFAQSIEEHTGIEVEVVHPEQYDRDRRRAGEKAL